MAVGLSGGGLRLAVAPTASPTATPTATPTPRPERTLSVEPSQALPSPITVTATGFVDVSQPIALAAFGGVLWDLAAGRIDRIDPRTMAVTGSVDLGAETSQYNGLAVDADGVWATDSDVPVVYRVDPATLERTTLTAGLAPKGVVATDAGVWVADVHGGAVLRIDPATNTIIDTTDVGPTGPSGPNWLASGLGSLWVGIPNNGLITRIDPVTGEIQDTIMTPPGFTPCGDLAVGTAAVWITGCSVNGRIARVDPATNAVVATVDLGGYGFQPTLINDRPWVSVDTGSPTAGMLVRIDPATNIVDRVLTIGAGFGGGGDIVVADGSVWVVDGYHGRILRLAMADFAP
jgi:streptogramin lyase